MLANPALALSIKKRLQGEGDADFDWLDTLELINAYYLNVQQQLEAPFVPGRVKQWLNMMRQQNPKAQALFDNLKQLRELDEITQLLDREIERAQIERNLLAG